MKKIRTLLLIDPQNGFIHNTNYTPNLPGGDMNLAVPGAEDDMKRITALISKNKDYFDNIRITLDSHHPLHIANPVFWKDKKGQHPRPFTPITSQDVKDGVWRTSVPGMQTDALYYLSELERTGKYTHLIWPPHCIIGNPGHNVYEPLRSALLEWENDFGIVDWTLKGSNYRREHFSGVSAEVEDIDDPSTKLNFDLVNSIENSDESVWAGIAGSHCVKSTGTSIADNFSDPSAIQKVVILKDCMSPVPGFEQQQENFINDMVSRGAKAINSTDLY